MKKPIRQDAAKCKGCLRADKYAKPEWHTDCTNGRRYIKSTINAATGETTWTQWIVGKCNCDCVTVTA